MGFDDLADDRQAKARILAERFAGRPVGVEAFEDAVDVVGPDAGAISSTVTMLTLPARASEIAIWPCSSGNEGAGILDQVGDDLADPEVMADDEIAFDALRQLADLELDLDRLLVARGLA